MIGLGIGLALLMLALLGLAVFGLIAIAAWRSHLRRLRLARQLEQRAFRTAGAIVGCCGSKEFSDGELWYTTYYPLVRYTGPDGLERMVETIDGMSTRPVPGQRVWLVLDPDDPGRAFLSDRPWSQDLSLGTALGVFLTVSVGLYVVVPLVGLALVALAVIGVSLASWNPGG